MNDQIRIRLSVGLIVVAIVHAILLAVVFSALHNVNKSSVDSAYRPPLARPDYPAMEPLRQLDQPPSVNLRAQNEVKQQILNNCPPCPTPTLAPTILSPSPNSTAAPTPPKKSFELALFVGSDSKSQQLLNWFANDPSLQQLRSHCEFQIYTASNPIYRSRYAQIVPVEQFPVVLFQDATGGHIHAAGHSMIPPSATELHSDLRRGYELYLQAKQAQKTGALKSRGYSWDAAITPRLSLSNQDCPDGYCPPESSDQWRPGDRLRDLFDQDTQPRRALLWLSSGEIATLALIVVAILLLGFILIKRGM